MDYKGMDELLYRMIFLIHYSLCYVCPRKQTKEVYEGKTGNIGTRLLLVLG